MYNCFYEDTHINHDCLNCSHSFVTDEDDNLYCPFHGHEPIDEEGWCDAWN